MGGMGSGATGFRRISEHCQRIDIRQWRKRGYLVGTWHFIWRWNVGGEPAGSTGVIVGDHQVTLRYTVHRDTDESVVQHIDRRAVPCGFGGWRHYFACPRCSRSVELLYLASGRFHCRHCARVSYAIENLDKQWRADRRYRALETRLNEDGSKPPRMRWKTYNRICERLEAYGKASESGLWKLLARYCRA